MDSLKSEIEILKSLENRELSAVTFVMDYVQLIFEEPCLNVYVWPLIRVRDSVFSLTTPGYRDVLCGQISKTVIRAYEESKEKLLIEFENQVVIEISLREEDRNGPEAAMLQTDSGKRWNVW